MDCCSRRGRPCLWAPVHLRTFTQTRAWAGSSAFREHNLCHLHISDSVCVALDLLSTKSQELPPFRDLLASNTGHFPHSSLKMESLSDPFTVSNDSSGCIPASPKQTINTAWRSCHLPAFTFKKFVLTSCWLLCGCTQSCCQSFFVKCPPMSSSPTSYLSVGLI